MAALISLRGDFDGHDASTPYFGGKGRERRVFFLSSRFMTAARARARGLADDSRSGAGW